MAKKVCVNCWERIGLFSRLTSTECVRCGALLHRTCGKITIDYDQFKIGVIEPVKFLCNECFKENLRKFGEERYCEICAADFTANENIMGFPSEMPKKCSVCGRIGHGECYKKVAKRVNPDIVYIYPYVTSVNKVKYLCERCEEEARIKIGRVINNLENWVVGTKG